MISPIRTCGFLTALLAAEVLAGPVAVRSSDIEVLPALQERVPSLTIGSYSLSTTHENDVLIKLGFGTTSANVGDAFLFEVECVDCRTWGTAVVTTSGASKDESIIGDIISFFENPVDTIISAFDLDVKVSFEDVGGHFEFDIIAADTVSYSIPIFESSTPAGIACSEDVTVGLIIAIDLVFSLTAEIDLEAGFEFSFPEGAYITVDPLSGNIIDHSFTGGQVDHLPIICTSGSATFKAALRVRIQAGTTVEVFGTGFDFELGVYADLIEYVATLGSTDQCELSITESVDVNIGAFAHAVVEIDYKTFGASPAVVTTILDVPLPSLCLTRPVDSSLPAFPTTTAIPETSPFASASNSFQSASGSLPIATGGASPTSTGGVFFQSSSSAAVSSPTAASSSSSPIVYTNSTITSAPSMTTSTVYTTDLITITSCAATVLHCPASLTSEIIITSTKILYTTVCPVGQIQPTSIPTTSSTSSSHPVSTASIIVSPIPLTPCATPVVSTVYTPTFINPTYALPTATVFTVPYPNWNVTSTSYTTSQVAPTSVPAKNVAGPSTITIAPVSSPPAAPAKSVVPVANGTVSGGSVKATATGSVPFTGGAAQSFGVVVPALIGSLGVCVFFVL